MNIIYDLIYCDIDEATELIEKYPDATIKDASDEVHEDRFSIEIEDTKKNYYKNLLTLGFNDVSLNFQVSIQTDEDQNMISELIDDLTNHLFN